MDLSSLRVQLDAQECQCRHRSFNLLSLQWDPQLLAEPQDKVHVVSALCGLGLAYGQELVNLVHTPGHPLMKEDPFQCIRHCGKYFWG